MKRMILSVHEGETRLAVLADGHLTDLATETVGEVHLLRRVYRGQVKNVVPALDAAFVDIGIGTNAYLPLLGGKVRDVNGKKIAVGSYVIAQIGKEARGNKGPMLTSKISLAGRYAVLLGAADYVGVSKKITDDAERERLRAIVDEVRENENCGYIVRTAAAEATERDLRRDLGYLRRTWRSILRRAEISRGALCLYREADLVLRAVRDYLTDSIEAIITDDANVYERLCEILGDEGENIEVVYEGGENLFRRYNIEEEIRPLLSRRVDLPSGGYLVFDTAEALTAIDVNSGTFRGGGNRAEMARRVNREAATEVARQLRLRNIGGIIIVDFIALPQPEEKEKLLAQLRRETGRDRVRTVVVGMTPLGLVEMTRRKTGNSLAESRYAPCAYCGGTGRIRTAASVTAGIIEKMDIALRERRLRGAVDIEVHPDVYEYAREHYPEKELAKRYARKVRWRQHTNADREVVSFLAGDE